jgi:molybdopterin converting factor small subunit
MQVSLKLFGPEARIVGRRELLIDVERLPIQCAKLRQRILEEEPRLSSLLATARFAVNFDFVEEDHLVGANDEVAIINQVCGG